MKKYLAVCFAVLCFSFSVFAQIPTATLVSIVKAEDERRFDKTLEDLLKNRAEKIRLRAALAAGRIGDDRAVLFLIELLETDSANEVRTTAAFALGEIESMKGADAILKVLANTKTDDELRARAIEAAGKIAAANIKDDKAKALGEAILDALEYEDARRSKPNTAAIRCGLTAILRVKPEDGDFVAAKFLTYMNPNIRADAVNTLSRLRAKNADEQLRAMLLSENDAVVRANVARALGAAEDAGAFDSLLEAALTDEDSRVRVSAIRALGSLKNAKAAGKLIERGTNLLTAAKNRRTANPPEKNELLEIAAALGKILPQTDDKAAVEFLDELHQADHFISPETEIALARIAPKIYLNSLLGEADAIFHGDWRASSAAFQGLAEIAALESNAENDAAKARARILVAQLLGDWINLSATDKSNGGEQFAIPDLVQAFAAFKSENTAKILRPMLEIERDIFIRAAIAAVLGEQPPNDETAANVESLSKAFDAARLNDRKYDDAELAMLDALFKLDKKAALPTLLIAADSKDYLVRKKAFEMLKDESFKDSETVKNALEKFAAAKKNQVSIASGSAKPGHLTNTNADYVRAVSRSNARAIVQTEKGSFTIEFAPEAAPLTVDNFINLAKANYFNGLAIHRVVPNFVMQDGDPRGDGNGSPGYSIRCEINMLSYERGAVGMALSGKDTGGSQWFVTHSPQPHLDGGYTVFGRVNETDMKIVDNLVRGDKILSVKIIEAVLRQKAKR